MNADILFVNLPPYESYYADGVPHLGMLYVLSSLRSHGYTVGYLDCARRGSRRAQIMERIRETSPRIVGFSIDTDNLFSAANFSHDLKREFGSELKIIFGGPASQGHPDEIMRRSAADVLVIGEGEYTTREVADSLLRGSGELRQVDGICYRVDDQIYFTGPRAPIGDLDALPFPNYDFLDDPLQYKPAIISGRGCPFKCTFCFEGRMGNRYRHRSPENIVAEIESLVERFGRTFICINDDTFTSDPQQTLRVCHLIRERFRPWEDLLWFCEVRADIVNRHPELIDAMMAAGVGRIQIGVESGDEDVLRAYKRLNVRPAVVEQVVGRFHRAGLPSIYCGFIVGGPHETIRTMERTLSFAKHLMTDVAPGSFECFPSYLTPLPGTEIREHPERFGVRLLDPDLLTSSNFNYPTTETDELSQSDINNFRWRFIEETDQAMRLVIAQLPWEIIARHARLYRRFNVSTAYYDRLRYFPRLTQYLNVVGDERLDHTNALSNDEMLERFPTRLSAPVRMDQETLTIGSGPTTVTLNGLGAQIYGLCSGKLRTREIVDQVALRLNGTAPPKDVLTEDVIEFVRHLDQNYAIFLKDF